MLIELDLITFSNNANPNTSDLQNLITNFDTRNALSYHKCMNVSLTPELEIWVENLVNSGMYQSSSEVMRTALRLLHKQETAPDERLKQLLAAIDRGIADVDAGRKTSLKDVTVASIREQAKKSRQ